jgi:hypothetical protein
MGFPNPAGANEEDIFMQGQECPLRQLQEPHFRDTREQGKVKVLQPFLVREGSGFEPLAQLLFMALSQFTFQQGL